MTSRTPIRLTPHRGPLATPSTSPECSPTSSTPPSDISNCSSSIRSALDVAILEHRIAALSSPTRYQSSSHPYRRRRELVKQGLFGCSTHLCPPSLIFESLLCSILDLAKSVGGIVTFCLLIWGVLEWSSYASEPLRQPTPSISLLRFPLPSPPRALRCHVNPSLCEPRDEHVALLQFLSEQVQHAKALSSLSIGLGLPLRAFIEVHHATIPRVTLRHNLAELPYLPQEVDTLANLTGLLDPSLMDFTSGSFIGRSLTLALDELGDLISEPMVPHGSWRPEHQDARLHAIYWRTTSNLLLEYSAARPRARRLLQQLRTLHQQLSPLVLSHHVARSSEGRLNVSWWKGGFRYPATSVEDGTQTFMTGLDITLDNVHRLIAYLDWVTDQLAQTTLRDVLKIRHRTDFSSCMMSLQELFTLSRPSTPKKFCFCLNDYDTTFIRPKRVEVMVPGSPTVRAGR